MDGPSELLSNGHDAVIRGTLPTQIYVVPTLSSICPQAPKKVNQLYGIEDISPILEYISVHSGMTMVSNIICWYFRAIKETSVNTAVGLSMIPWIVLGVHSILNEKPKELGFPLWAEWFNLVFFSVVAHATLTSADYANSATKAIAIWALLNGLLLAANPALFGKVYQTAERDDVVLLGRRNYGYNLCCTAVFLYSLATEVNMSKAVGYSWVPALVGLISMMFITKDFDKLNLPMGPPVYFWLFVEALVVYTLAF